MFAFLGEGGAFSQARYARQTRLPELGAQGQLRLRDSSVLVLGAGGLGSPVLQYLAAAGVGRLGIIDDDVVEESNLHRQILHDHGRVGQLKVHSAARRIHDQVGGEVQIDIHPVRLTNTNAASLFSEYDLVVDGADNFPTRYLVSDVSAEVNIPVVWGSILGFNSQLSVFWAKPPEHLSPGGGVTLRDVFPTSPEPGTVPSCAEAGVIGALCGQAGSIMAMEALKMLGQFGQPLFGRLLVLDALRGTSQTLQIRPDGRDPSIRFPSRANWELPVVNVETVRAKDWLLVDVREQDEFAAGHAKGALSAPLTSITEQNAGEWVQRLRTSSSGRSIALYCKSGIRSRQAAAMLAAAGLQGLYQLEGDFPGWAQSGAPVGFGNGNVEVEDYAQR